MTRLKVEVVDEHVSNDQVLLLSINLNEIGYVYEFHSYIEENTLIFYNKE